MELLCECDTLLRRGGGFSKGGDVIAFTPKEALERENSARENNSVINTSFRPK